MNLIWTLLNQGFKKFRPRPKSPPPPSLAYIHIMSVTSWIFFAMNVNEEQFRTKFSIANYLGNLCHFLHRDVFAEHRQWVRLEELLSIVNVRQFSANLVVWGGAADFYALFVTLKRAIVENTFLETGERISFRIELHSRLRQFSWLRMAPLIASTE